MRLRCWVCKVLGCRMGEPETVVRAPRFGLFDYLEADPKGWVALGKVRACERCGHYEGSAVCGGRR